MNEYDLAQWPMTSGLVSYLTEYSSELEASSKPDKVIFFPEVLHKLDFNLTLRFL